MSVLSDALLELIVYLTDKYKHNGLVCAIHCRLTLWPRHEQRLHTHKLQKGQSRLENVENTKKELGIPEAIPKVFPEQCLSIWNLL